MAHIEVIHPGERLAPSLGGTGYLPPAQPSSAAELRADLEKADSISSIGFGVWKVKRESPKQPRRLKLPNGRYLPCAVIGGIGYDGGYWWFVSVSTAKGRKALR